MRQIHLIDTKESCCLELPFWEASADNFNTYNYNHNPQLWEKKALGYWKGQDIAYASHNHR